MKILVPSRGTQAAQVTVHTWTCRGKARLWVKSPSETGDNNLPRIPGENLTPPQISEKTSECLRLEKVWAGTFPFKDKKKLEIDGNGHRF